ncbi:MAG: amidase domain-containing protein [Clostridia bacterium]|nr:amidase domain-containing protein [Clostridia bacterium]
MSYNRNLAVEYALKWSLDRNPKYYNYDKIGGDCTNFISQSLFAGTGQMNYRKNGWYYRDANNKSPSWTGVEFLYNFLISNKYEGPKGKEITKENLQLGDIIQLSFNGVIFGHTLIVTKIDEGEIYVCAHTIDAKNRKLDSYNYKKIRYVMIY